MIMDDWGSCIGGMFKVLLTLVILLIFMGIGGQIWSNLGSLQFPVGIVFVLLLLISMAMGDNRDGRECASIVFAFIVASVVVFGCFFLLLSFG